MKKFPNIKTLAWKSTKTQEWNTDVKRSGSGKVRTLTTWQKPKWTITTSFAYLTPEDYKTILGFFASLRGASEPFLWLDPEDYRETGIQLGTGEAGAWQALRSWGDYREPVSHIEDLTLYADGEEIEAKTENGIITALGSATADAVITADYTYFWKVMLADDAFTAELVFQDIYKSKEMKLVTVD